MDPKKEKEADAHAETSQEKEAAVESQNQQADWSKDDKFLFRDDSQQIQLQSVRAPGLIARWLSKLRNSYCKELCCVLMILLLVMVVFTIATIVLSMKSRRDE